MDKLLHTQTAIDRKYSYYEFSYCPDELNLIDKPFESCPKCHIHGQAMFFLDNKPKMFCQFCGTFYYIVMEEICK